MAATREQEKADTGTNTTTDITFDSTPTTGNILVSCLSIDKQTGGITKPTDWTVVETTYTSTNISGGMAWKISTGDESGAQNWSWTTSKQFVCWMVEYSGIDMFDKSAESDTGLDAESNLTVGPTGLLTVSSNNHSVAMWGSDTFTNWSPDTYDNGHTERYNQLSGTNCLAVADDARGDNSSITVNASDTAASDQIFARIATFYLAAADDPISIPSYHHNTQLNRRYK